jgi:hypothetical protein
VAFDDAKTLASLVGIESIVMITHCGNLRHCVTGEVAIQNDKASTVKLWSSFPLVASGEPILLI